MKNEFYDNELEKFLKAMLKYTAKTMTLIKMAPFEKVANAEKIEIATIKNVRTQELRRRKSRVKPKIKVKTA